MAPGTSRMTRTKGNNVGSGSGFNRVASRPELRRAGTILRSPSYDQGTITQAEFNERMPAIQKAVHEAEAKMPAAPPPPVDYRAVIAGLARLRTKPFAEQRKIVKSVIRWRPGDRSDCGEARTQAVSCEMPPETAANSDCEACEMTSASSNFFTCSAALRPAMKA